MLRAEDVIRYQKSLCSSEISLKYGACGLKFVTSDDAETHGELIPTVLTENPYKKFIRRVRKAESQTECHINLGRKSGEITKSIINEFLNWYNSLGGGEGLIDASTIEELFQIGFDAPSTPGNRDLLATPDVPVIPRCRANAFRKRELPEKSHKEVKETKKSMGKSNKSLDRSNPAKGPSEQQTMAIIWDGIENLWSTVSFAQWLREHPEMSMPAYFKQNNLHKVDVESLVKANKYFDGVGTVGDLIAGSLLIPVIESSSEVPAAIPEKPRKLYHPAISKQSMKSDNSL